MCLSAIASTSISAASQTRGAIGEFEPLAPSTILGEPQAVKSVPEELFLPRFIYTFTTFAGEYPLEAKCDHPRRTRL
jgi:hypothetical protein